MQQTAEHATTDGHAMDGHATDGHAMAGHADTQWMGKQRILSMLKHSSSSCPNTNSPRSKGVTTFLGVHTDKRARNGNVGKNNGSSERGGGAGRKTSLGNERGTTPECREGRPYNV
ncbi:hypothetical protein THAOC_14064 [Thalassiosira oceanica]|uniref:Uncharacterized protein n=1 Tax=Thalassiosira oceanica TaxID=159749 RepID=K0SID9_THAOC|nr:hypothetical protein THAOC_14064 [Thalassiosira oceanica]|eukprot:EJK65120.1 hypothetical protein THAOC_14064 [Thalassiosira oceanica]